MPCAPAFGAHRKLDFMNRSFLRRRGLAWVVFALVFPSTAAAQTTVREGGDDAPPSCIAELVDALTAADPSTRAYASGDAAVDASVHAEARRWMSPELMGLVHGSIDPRNPGIMRVEAGIAQAIPRGDRYERRQDVARTGHAQIDAARVRSHLDRTREVEARVVRRTLLDAQLALLDETRALLHSLVAIANAGQGLSAQTALDGLEIQEVIEEANARTLVLDGEAAAIDAWFRGWERGGEGIAAIARDCRWDGDIDATNLTARTPSAGEAVAIDHAAAASHPALAGDLVMAEALRREAIAMRSERTAEPMVRVALTVESMRFMGMMEDSLRPGLMVGLTFPLPARRDAVEARATALESRAREQEAVADAMALELVRSRLALEARERTIRARLLHLRDERRPLVRELLEQMRVEAAWNRVPLRALIDLGRRDLALTTEELDLLDELASLRVEARWLAADGRHRAASAHTGGDR